MPDTLPPHAPMGVKYARSDSCSGANGLGPWRQNFRKNRCQNLRNPPSAPTRLEHLRRELPTQVLRGGARRTPAPRSALEEADLDEIRLVDLLEGLAILADRGG